MIKKISDSKFAEARHRYVDDALHTFEQQRKENGCKKIIILFVDDHDAHNYVVAGTSSKLETLGLLAIHQAVQANDSIKVVE